MSFGRISSTTKILGRNALVVFLTSKVSIAGVKGTRGKQKIGQGDQGTKLYREPCRN